MSEFVTELEVTLISDDTNSGRGTWQLDKPLVYQSDLVAALIVVPKGFQTDFASVPRVPIAYWLFGDTSHEASVVHDFLYNTHLYPRATADAILKEASAVTGIPAWRRWGMYLGVRIGGAGPWDGEVRQTVTN